MLIGEVPEARIAAALAGDGLALEFGAARARVRGNVDGLASAIRIVYGAYPLVPCTGFFDVTASLRGGTGLHRFVRRQVVFVADGEPLFEPFPADTHLPLLEWGLNYLLAERFNHCVMLHAGAVERGGRAILLPAMPGSGKSTLTAALVSRGYRLLSDEFGVLSLDDGRLRPLLRPIALKNESIGLMRSFAPASVIGPSFEKTRKGTVAHFAPDAASVAAKDVPALPALVVFPQFDAQTDLLIEKVPKARAFAKLAVNSFNYEILGPRGFDAITRMMLDAPAFRLVYRDLDRAIAALDRLLEDAASGAAIVEATGAVA